MAEVLSPTNNKWDYVGTIETACGSDVDVLNITPDMVVLEDIASSLSKICRYNGHLPVFYSVAEHSVRVAAWIESQGYGPEVVLTGLLHDAAEAYVGDMMRPLKKVPAISEVFTPIEDAAHRAVHAKLGGVYPHPDIVHVADREQYDWEVRNVRNGEHVGLTHEAAYIAFINMYNRLTGRENTLMHTTESVRRDLLDEAAELVDGDRNAQYGDPTQDFRRTSVYWSTHAGGVLRRKLSQISEDITLDDLLIIVDSLFDPHDVAIMMNQLKDSRLAWDPLKRDTWVDKAGYSACGYDCVTRS
jgi:hypothetical protein